MFERIVEFFTKAQEIKDARFDEFEKFHLECIKTFPADLKSKLRSSSIHPIAYDPKVEKLTNHKHSEWVMAFNAKDVLWWREQYKIDNFTIIPIEILKNRVREKCLELLDSLPIGEMNDYSKDLYDALLNEEMEKL